MTFPIGARDTLPTTHNNAALISQSLEQAAEHIDDLTPLVYARYFSYHPEASVLFGNDSDDSLKGEMLAKLVLQIMDYAEGRSDPDIIVSWASDHMGYGVPLAMFPAMFRSVKETLIEAVDTAWTQEVDLAWEQQFDGLLFLIDQAYQRFAPMDKVV